MILILNGSPKNDGNTAWIAAKAKEAVEKYGETAEIIDVTDVLKSMGFPFCVACTTPCYAACSKGNEMEKAHDKIREANGMIIVSPVYFGGMTGELKAFWDLLRALRREKVFYNMPGAAVSVGASRFGGQESTVKAMHDMMLIQGMVVVGNGFEDNMGHQGACFQRPAAEDKDGIAALERTAGRIVEVARLLREE